MGETTNSQTNLGVLDTRFRSALNRMAAAGRIETYGAAASTNLEIAAIMKKRDGGQAVLFPPADDHDMPIIGNLLCCQKNCEAAFGVEFGAIRTLVGRALGNPQPPEAVDNGPAQETVLTNGFDLTELLPALYHTEADSGRFVTAGVVIAADPETGVHNASFHRLQLVGPQRTGIQLDYGRHLRIAFEKAQRSGEDLPIVVCLGTDLALQYTAATMGSQMPEGADEIAVAGGLSGQPLPVLKGVTQDLPVPAESEIVLEGKMLASETVREGPFGEFVGFLSPEGDAPVVEITAVTHRERPIYHAINGYGRETVMLRKYVLEASLLNVLQTAIPIVTDAEMTAGGLHRFHAVIQVKKTTPQHNGLQRNAIAAAFGALKDLDLVTVVDDDIDIRDPADVEYAMATRFEASKDLIKIPGARGHEYVRASADGIRTKLGIDATVPFEEQERFRRCEFLDIAIDDGDFTTNADALGKLSED
ncbi:MAG TPA: hypothetical protein DCS82_03125 [Rhodospirillaceae bacterium]|nr:hypothetical protein [Rhodospirillaceae bacterium]HAA90945.1 hypothetical protein [Rhodospirillaceae bacterium]HAT34682.1 hypothetical protein [Rhodospirillaceae bacterium]